MTIIDSEQVRRLGEEFDPFRDPYLADPYPFFARARAAAPLFHSPRLGYWVVTRYQEIQHVFQRPEVYSAANVLEPIRPIWPRSSEAVMRCHLAANRPRTP